MRRPVHDRVQRLGKGPGVPGGDGMAQGSPLRARARLWRGPRIHRGHGLERGADGPRRWGHEVEEADAALRIERHVGGPQRAMDLSGTQQKSPHAPRNIHGLLERKVTAHTGLQRLRESREHQARPTVLKGDRRMQFWQE